MDYMEQVLRIALPLILAALAGVTSERSGVINIALEGKILVGAFVSTMVAFGLGGYWPIAMLAGIAAGGLWGLLYGVLVVIVGAEEIITGLALNMLAAALSSALLVVSFGQGQNSPTVSGISGDVFTNPLVIVCLVISAITLLNYYKMVPGLRMRACGDSPHAVEVAGLSIRTYRLLATTIAGCLCGLAGSYLALSIHGFTQNMSAGRGYIALALVVMSGWRPLLACAGALVLAALEAQAIRAGVSLPTEIVRISPYLFALVVLAAIGSRARAPRALGAKMSE